MEKIPHNTTPEEKLTHSNNNLAELGMNENDVKKLRQDEVTAIINGEALPTALGMEFTEIQTAFMEALKKMTNEDLQELSSGLKNAKSEIVDIFENTLSDTEKRDTNLKEILQSWQWYHQSSCLY